MGHARDLLDRIARKVVAAWPAEQGYRLLFEAPCPLERRMLPDIQVLGPDGAVCCAVEIGYTRPEKLTAYRRLGIPDVRWYDKAGRLHGDVSVTAITRWRQEDHLRPRKDVRWLQLWEYGARCRLCEDELVAAYCGAHFAGASEQQPACDCQPRVPLSDDDACTVLDECADMFGDRTDVYLFSNGVRVGGFVVCDECGESYQLEDFEDVILAVAGSGLYFDNAMDFEAAHHRWRRGREFQAFVAEVRQRGPMLTAFVEPVIPWADVLAVGAYYGLTLRYQHFVPWSAA
jgi:hypothetical protein